MACNIGSSDTRTNGNTICNILFYLVYWETKGTERNIREEQWSVIKGILEYYLPEDGDDIKNEGNKVIQKVLPSSTNVKKHDINYSVSSQGRINSSKPSQSSILGSEVIVSVNGTGNYTFYNIIENSNSTNASQSRKPDESSLIFILRKTCKKIARIIEEYRIELIAKGQMTPSNHGPIKVRLVVVSSQVFVEAMRQYHVETIVLTYTNVFPSDIRMFLSVPVYMYGYINTKDQL